VADSQELLAFHRVQKLLVRMPAVQDAVEAVEMVQLLAHYSQRLKPALQLTVDPEKLEYLQGVERYQSEQHQQLLLHYFLPKLH
jgi:hypothetical protein